MGANYCLDAIYQSGDAKCIHNPATGREQTLTPRASPPAPARRRAVVVGAGPAGLEAARVLGERGHQVVVLEAADVPGGQVRLAAAAARRRDLIGIVDWRVSRGQALRGRVPLRRLRRRRRRCWPSAPTWWSSPPAGCPNRSFLRRGEHLVIDTWDVMAGAAHPQGRVLVYDDNGAEPALDAAELLAGRGAAVELVTPERMLGPVVGSMNSPAYLRAFAEHDVTVTLARRLTGVRRGDGRRGWWRGCAASTPTSSSSGTSTTSSSSTARCPTTSSTSTWCRTRATSARSTTARCWPSAAQTVSSNPDGRFQLFRIGDAVASRNIHAAIYDALRLCPAI